MYTYALQNNEMINEMFRGLLYFGPRIFAERFPVVSAELLYQWRVRERFVYVNPGLNLPTSVFRTKSTHRNN